MPCGLLHVETFCSNSGYWSWQNFTHAGQQDVISGRFRFSDSRSRNSCASSIMVRSADSVTS